MLAGDLVLKGHGDPKLTLENFWLLLREPARPRRARDPRRPRARPQLLRRRRLRPGALRRAADAPLQHRAGRAARQLQGGAARSSCPTPRRARCASSSEPTLPQVQVVNQPRARSTAPCGDWVGAAEARRAGRREPRAPHLQRPLFARIAASARAASACCAHAQYVLACFASCGASWAATFAGDVRDGAAGADARLHRHRRNRPRCPRSCATSTSSATT